MDNLFQYSIPPTINALNTNVDYVYLTFIAHTECRCGLEPNSVIVRKIVCKTRVQESKEPKNDLATK